MLERGSEGRGRERERDGERNQSQKGRVRRHKEGGNREKEQRILSRHSKWGRKEGGREREKERAYAISGRVRGRMGTSEYVVAPLVHQTSLLLRISSPQHKDHPCDMSAN